jgi:hypothetical protein
LRVPPRATHPAAPFVLFGSAQPLFVTISDERDSN